MTKKPISEVKQHLAHGISSLESLPVENAAKHFENIDTSGIMECIGELVSKVSGLKQQVEEGGGYLGAIREKAFDAHEAIIDVGRIVNSNIVLAEGATYEVAKINNQQASRHALLIERLEVFSTLADVFRGEVDRFDVLRNEVLEDNSNVQDLRDQAEEALKTFMGEI